MSVLTTITFPFHSITEKYLFYFYKQSHNYVCLLLLAVENVGLDTDFFFTSFFKHLKILVFNFPSLKIKPCIFLNFYYTHAYCDKWGSCIFQLLYLLYIYSFVFKPKWLQRNKIELKLVWFMSLMFLNIQNIRKFLSNLSGYSLADGYYCSLKGFFSLRSKVFSMSLRLPNYICSFGKCDKRFHKLKSQKIWCWFSMFVSLL